MNDDWRHRARCRTADPELFFPVGVITKADKLQANRAKAVCKLCPVKDECLDWALDTGQKFGVLGGLTEAERKALRRKRVPAGVR